MFGKLKILMGLFIAKSIVSRLFQSWWDPYLLKSTYLTPIHCSSSHPTSVIGKYISKHSCCNRSCCILIRICFCRGSRFQYQYYKAEDSSSPLHLRQSSKPSDITTPIHKSISNLDHAGMKIIEDLDHKAFTKYLRETENTICGRHPIGVLLAALAKLKEQGQHQRLKFVHYDQSSPCKTPKDSSVSYASAFAITE
jgi:hypothetical protein